MIKRQDGWLSAQVGDEVVMMSATSGVYIGLNEVGARVWALIETPRDIGDICEGVAAEFEISPEACRPEIEAFLEDLEKRGVIHCDG